jgi:hypothetical protein
VEIASSASLSDSAFVAGARKFAIDIRVVFKVAMLLMCLVSDVLAGQRNELYAGTGCFGLDRTLKFGGARWHRGSLPSADMMEA